MTFDKKQFRGDVRQILKSAHSKTVQSASRVELANAVQQAALAIMGWFDDVEKFKQLVQDAVRDFFKGK